MEMLRLWSLWRGGGMAPGPLPEAGGIMDQPAIMLEAFAAMTAAVIMPGRQTGMMISHKMRRSVAPSVRAASSISCGMSSM